MNRENFKAVMLANLNITGFFAPSADVNFINKPDSVSRKFITLVSWNLAHIWNTLLSICRIYCRDSEYIVFTIHLETQTTYSISKVRRNHDWEGELPVIG